MHDFMSDLQSYLLVSCVAVVYEFGGGGRRVGCDSHGCFPQIWGRWGFRRCCRFVGGVVGWDFLGGRRVGGGGGGIRETVGWLEG